MQNMGLIKCKSIFFIFSILLFTSCKGQDNNEIKKTEKDIYSIGNVIKHFEKEPCYEAIISTNNCSFEILINDLPIIKHKDNSGGGLAGAYFTLNWSMFKSGNQKITVKLTPGFNQTEDKQYETLQKNSGVKVQIVKTYQDKNGESTEEIEILSYQTPEKEVENRKISSFNGLKSFEDSISFQAEIPYSINTLDSAEVLYTTNQEARKVLEKEVVSKYNEVRNIYLKGTKADLANLNYNKEKRIAQQMFYTSKVIKDSWDNDYQFRTDTNLEFFDLKPVEKYKMKFYATGKLVCLEKINNDRSALWGGFKRKDKDFGTTTYIQLYLYRKKGTRELQSF